MMWDDTVMWTWSLPLVEQRGGAVDSSRPQDSGRRTGEMTLGPTSVGTRQTFGKRPSPFFSPGRVSFCNMIPSI